MNKNFQKKTAYDHVKQTKKENFTFLNEKYAQQGQTVLFGDSITEIFNSYECFMPFRKQGGRQFTTVELAVTQATDCWKGSNVTP